MDFLDPKRQRMHLIRLLIGYVFVSVAIVFAAYLLLVQAYGFGYKKGEVVQNGLMFVSSNPAPANIYLNGALASAPTNARLNLQEGDYNLKLTRAGYRSWERTIRIDGNKIVRYDYPFLFATDLTSSSERTYDQAPQMVTASLDRRWLLTSSPSDIHQLELLDVKDPKAPITQTLTVPVAMLTASAEAQSWQAVEWASDNQHVILKHLFGDASEYILVDRSQPDKSVNLTQLLGQNPTELKLIDKHYDRYYEYSAADQTLRRASLTQPSAVPYLDHVLAYKTYGSDTVAYAASPGLDSADTSVKIKLVKGSNTYTLRQFTGGASYNVDIAAYSGSMYVVAAASNDDRVYVYMDPIQQITDPQLGLAVPIRVLRVSAPAYLSFSLNSRFVMVENGTHFAVYDAEVDRSYTYTSAYPLDTPQLHANWMDGHRLEYVSNGEAVVFDYDNTNRQQLIPARPEYDLFFDNTYKYLYTFSPSKVDGTKTSLDQTPLRIPADR